MQHILCLIILCVIVSTAFGDDVISARQGVRRKKNRACRYQKGEWSDCNQVTQTMTRTLTLKRGDPSECETRKEMSLSCKKVERKLKKLNKKVCKYSKGDWSKCDPITNKRSRTLTLRVGDASHCENTKSIMRKCQKLKKRQRKKKLAASKAAKGCKYQLGEWTDCDEKTNTRSRTLTLRSRDVQSCQSVKILYRKCKKPCKFSKGKWSQCDMETQLMERVDTLTGGNDNFCEPTRKITKKCGKQKQDGGRRTKAKCKYHIGNWSDCDPDTNLRSRAKQLVAGDPVECEEEEVFTRSCARPNGKERCFFGDWGDYGPCQNGVMKNQRPVLQGGIECQRRGVKTKPCDNNGFMTPKP